MTRGLVLPERFVSGGINNQHSWNPDILSVKLEMVEKNEDFQGNTNNENSITKQFTTTLKTSFFKRMILKKSHIAQG